MENYIKAYKYSNRLGKILLNVYHFDKIYNQNGVKHIWVKESVESLAPTIFENINDEKMWLKPMSNKEKVDMFLDLMEKNKEQTYKDLDDFMIILYNQILVSMHSIFDYFLLNLIKTVLNNDNKLISRISNEVHLNPKEILNSINTDELLNKIIKKYLKGLEFNVNIHSKIKILNDLGLLNDNIFDLKNSKTVDENILFLKHICSIRNEVVHNDTYPIRRYSDLEEIESFLNRLIFHFGVKSAIFFNIKLDMTLWSSGVLTMEQMLS